ncbi:hypothetical protein ACH5RR_004435 [Cinchona calisaya]|uniref:SHSP domain-containing protein n=1 Tax=Cinchona calisaya TaxID=153742 RepID=A0ABD3AXM9_9GENT
MEAKTGAAGLISYEEFEPFCKWQREEACDTLVVHLPEFKKEQLRVHINNRGILKVSGERRLDATKTSKFYKEVVVPRNCDANGIQAKFANNHLYIIMPKKINVVVPEKNKSQQVVAGSSIIDPSSVDQNIKTEAAGKDPSTPPPLYPPSNKMGKMVISTSPTTPNNDRLQRKKSVSRGKRVAKIAVNVGMVMAVLAALTAFVVYMYKSTLVED